MVKKVNFGEEATKKLLNGINVLGKAVGSTLGPKGRNVIIEKYNGVHVTKDGVTVAKDIFLEDSLENLGVSLVKEAALKTAEIAGDGTTTSTILANFLCSEGYKYLTGGANPVDIKRGMDKAVEAVINALENNIKREVDGTDDLYRVAKISANNDENVAKLINEAINKAGKHGVITVEKSRTGESYIETVEGMEFDSGILGSIFITDPDRGKFEAEDVHYFLYDGKLTTAEEVMPVVEYAFKNGVPVVVIAEHVEGQAAELIAANVAHNKVKMAVVRTPGYNDKIKHLIDIAVTIGGVIFSKNGKYNQKKDPLDGLLGRSAKFVSTKANSKIIGGFVDKGALESRTKAIEEELMDDLDNFQKDILKNRLAKLTNGIVVIKVGAASEVESKEIIDRVDDALASTRAAKESGIVPGGGVALLRASQLYNKYMKVVNNSDEGLGEKLLISALSKPTETIAENGGLSGLMIKEKVLEGEDDYGFDAYEENYGHLFAKGVIDPCKVTVTALKNAASVAGMFLTSNVSITNLKENK